MTGPITAEWSAGLAAGGTRPFHGEDAAEQTAPIADVVPHETAVRWVRTGLTRATPPKAEEESREAFMERPQRVVAAVDADHDVEGLCRRTGSVKAKDAVPAPGNWVRTIN